jgi:glycosyltransferase involved in cell wall biosynthesis
VKLFFLCKRRPQGRDLLTRPYGRFFYLPEMLSRKGHEVFIFLLSYKHEPPMNVEQGHLTWFSESIQPFGPLRYLQRVQEMLQSNRPDWIVGFSDTYYGILAVHLGKKFGIRSVIDAYDNYESYISWLKPLHMLWRSALGRASVVTAAGPHLASLLQQSRPEQRVDLVPMAADPEFLPLNRDECRVRMKLPLTERLIGYCGALFRSRGIEVLFEAYDEMRRMHPEIRLILSGRKQRSVYLPDQAQWLGYLPDQKIPILLNAMDALTVIGQISTFGRFSYPVKLYEAMACRIPVVATATEPATWILNGQDDFLSRPGDPGDLAKKLERQLTRERMDYGTVNRWEESAEKFEMALRSCG